MAEQGGQQVVAGILEKKSWQTFEVPEQHISPIIMPSLSATCYNYKEQGMHMLLCKLIFHTHFCKDERKNYGINQKENRSKLKESNIHFPPFFSMY